MKAKQSYFKSMIRDSSKSKQTGASVFKLENFKVVTDNELSTGSLENEKGNVLKFKVPDIPQMVLSDGTIIPAQNNLKIIGWGTIRETIVIFTTNEFTTSPTTSYGQIWAFKFSETTDTVENIQAGNFLSIADHLKYNNQINFTTSHRIGRVIGRYENTNTQKVYWTDNYNPVRVLNIADPDSLDIDPENIDLSPSVDFSQAIVTRIGNGAIPIGSVVQYSYRLLDSGGGETIYAPVSALTPLFSQDPYSGTWGDVQGSPPNTSFSKSVTYSINGLDTDFRVIEHIAIIYEAHNNPRIVKFGEQFIPSSGTVEVIHTGDETYIDIDPLEFNILSSGFEVAKDIEVKDNRLIAANTKTTQFDIDFDARAYRFRNVGGNIEAELRDSGQGNITLTSPTPAYSGVPEDHDAINPYNNENDVTWDLLLQYKYQEDGTTIGGSGINISYEFTQEAIPSNFKLNNPTGVDHLEVDRWGSTDGPFSLGILNPDGTNQNIEIASQNRNFAAPYNHTHFRGYAREEVYRFGIVFYSKKGSPSFVKWIGDIKFPAPADGFPIQSVTNDIPDMFSLGIEFTVNVSSIADQISGYSFVRLKREESDKTRLGTGALMLYDIQDQAYFTSLPHLFEAGGIATNPYRLTDDVNIEGSLKQSVFHVGDKPGFNDPQINAATAKAISYLVSPLGQFQNSNNYEFGSNDYIKTTGYYKANAVRVYEDANTSYGFYYKLLNFSNLDHSNERFQIKDSAVLRIGEFVESGTGILSNGISGTNSLLNASYSRSTGTTANTPLGLGSPKHTLILDSSPNLTNCVAASTMDWFGTGDYRTATFTGDVSSDMYFKEVAYCRYLTSQYGGDTYEDRSSNQYISTNHFQSVNAITGDNHTVEVYGGDTSVHYYDDETVQMYFNKETALDQKLDDPADEKLSIAVVCPCESSINVEYREGRRWMRDRDYTSIGDYESNEYRYNQVYRQENTVAERFFAPDFLSNFNEEQPHRIWASESKIDGELVDSWRVFKANNSVDVNGVLGPINRIINFRDNLMFYQDSGFGVAPIDERSTIVDDTGTTLTIGNGAVLDSYGYISNKTGCIHQFAIVATESAVYHYDARLRKFYGYTGQPIPLSDIKEFSGFFWKNVQGSITDTDKTTGNDQASPIGIHAIEDPRYNRVIYTFLNNDTSDSEFSDGFTIAFNEVLQGFEQFLSYKPPLYLNTGRRLISTNPDAMGDGYVHNIGEYGQYYDSNPVDSTITMILNPDPSTANIFNNIEYFAELTLNNTDIFDETFSSIRIYNEYQDTGTIVLTPNTNIKRRIRKWRFTIPRDNTGNDARIRNPWTFVELKFTNNDNKRFVLHDLIYSFNKSSH